MSDIIKYQPEHTNPDLEPQRVIGLENFPASVRELFGKLPDNLRAQIIRSELTDGTVESKLRSLEDVVASFDNEKREEFMMVCLMELFRVGQI